MNLTIPIIISAEKSKEIIKLIFLYSLYYIVITQEVTKMDKEYEDDYYPQHDEVDIMPDENYAQEPTDKEAKATQEYLNSFSDEEVQAMWDATVEA